MYSAINKPQWSSSAGVLRDLQDHFARSPLFAPWLESQKRTLILSNARPKHMSNLKVKLGHGGTLDPMATGVLIVGVGKGTKQLGKFLECTKSYECVVLFGAATDSYDAVGKVVSKAPYEHVTRALVEEKLAQFRGKIMQKPSVFSALKVDGKKMYEYAREGKDIPQVAPREVEVHEIELVEWLEPGSHAFAWPKEEVDGTEMEGAEKLLGIRKQDADVFHKTAAKKARKRSRSPEQDLVAGTGEQPKRPRTDSEPAMSGALLAEDAPRDTAGTEEQRSLVASVPNVQPTLSSEDQPVESIDPVPASEPHPDASAIPTHAPEPEAPTPIQPPAARIRMTVTSGFYVRSLCHDLGLACSSLGLMASLIRSRQGDYTLGTNVVDFSDLEKGADVWEPQVKKQLDEFMKREGWEAEELEEDDAWHARKKQFQAQRKEDDRDRSFRGGGRGKGWGRGGGGGGGQKRYYDKKMGGGRRED